jgi:hypothetical protein
MLVYRWFVNCQPPRHGFLWKLTIPSLVDPASSVHRILATNCVYNAFCEEWLAKSHPCTTVGRSGGGMGKVTVHGEFSRQGERRYIQSCNSLHTSSGIFSHTSQYANFSKTRPYPGRHWLMDIRRLGFFCSLEYYIPLRPVTSRMHSQVPATWDYQICCRIDWYIVLSTSWTFESVSINVRF